ncbi:MAG: RHS domain-containing protein, partial [Nitrospirae bacterium]|nr:RHS domain-containing protein [Nitrospirota bacterium]
DENGNTTTFTYDALNRLLSVKDPKAGVTSYTYDKRNNLKTITDAGGKTTAYTYDSLNRLISSTSPDTGAAAYSYDPNGNIITKTDASDVTTTDVYDALNRQTAVHFPDSTQNINYFYDYAQLQNSTGRLSSMTELSGTTWYDYDKMGRVIKETKQINNLVYRTEYTYDLDGNVLTVTYPGGRAITYTYNQQNRVASLKEAFNGTMTTLADNITYNPSGGMTSFSYGNSLPQSITYNQRHQINSIITGGIQITYSRDAKGNITGITNNFNTIKNRTFAYDSLDRLTNVTGLWGTIAYSYNSASNRTSEATNTGNTTYNYTANKLISSTGVKPFTFSYDNNGNTISENTRQYIYNQNQRLIKVTDTDSGIVLGEYVYNGNGQRAKKFTQNSSQCAIFHYDQQGLLIAESTGPGTITSEYIYLNGQPLAKIEGSNIYYYHNDHLGTPMVMTNENQSIVWQGEFLPFGEPLSVSGTITNNLRFPGQYYDAETGLHYNYFRDYKPEIGRYVEADPILQPMINLISDSPGCSKSKLIWYVPNLIFTPQDISAYSYVKGNPVNSIDSTGLICGTKDIDKYIPDAFPGFNFSSACSIHDKCYEDCSKSKSECDNQFLVNMLKECLTLYYAPRCVMISGSYYLAVSKTSAGQKAYEEARKQKCCK